MPKRRKRKAPKAANTRRGSRVDRISNLPVDIIHQILSCVSLKDAVKASMLSKRWQSIWDSRPNIHLDECLFGANYFQYLVEDLYVAQRHAFFTYLYKSLVKREKCEYNTCEVDILFLRMTVDNSAAELLVKKWIDYALKNMVKSLHLSLRKSSRYHFYIDDTIAFDAATLVELSLRDCNIINCSFVLPNLRSLFLCKVWIDDDDFEDLIAGCPQIERLHIENSDNLFTIIVSNPTLKYFGIQDYGFEGLIQIESTNLESLELADLCDEMCDVEISSTTTVKSLILRHVDYQESTLTHFINKFPLLEKLVVHRGTSLDEIEEIRIDAPKLKSFEYFGNLTTFPGIEASLELEFVEVHLYPEARCNSRWYMWLRKCLESFAHSKYLSLFCNTEKEIIFPDELTDRLLPQISDIKNLELEITKCTATPQEILDGFIWILPGLKILKMTLGSMSKLIQFPHREWC